MELNKNLPYPSVSRVMEITKFKDPATAEAAIATLLWLDSGAPHKLSGLSDKPVYFNMEKYISDYVPDNVDCGTSCCMAGAITLHKLTGEIKGQAPLGGRTALERAFNMNADDLTDELTQLFFPCDRWGSCIQKTSEEAAYTLRKYLFTGKVEWKSNV